MEWPNVRSFIERFARKRYVTLGGRRIAARPMGLEDALRFTLLVAPHVAAAERQLPDIQAALKDASGRRPDLLSAALGALAAEMQSAPGDLTRAVALLAGVDAGWLAQNATALEVVRALPALGQVNDLVALVQAVRSWGVMVRYKEPA